MAHLHPVKLQSADEFTVALNNALKKEYDTGGDMTHIAYDDYDAVIALFPVRGTGKDRWRFAVLFRDIDEAGTFVDEVEEGQDRLSVYPDEWQLFAWDDGPVDDFPGRELDGSVIDLETVSTFF